MPFMHYAATLYRQRAETDLYRTYTAEALRAIGAGEYLKVKYTELTHPPEDFDVNEVIDDVISRAGLEVNE